MAYWHPVSTPFSRHHAGVQSMIETFATLTIYCEADVYFHSVTGEEGHEGAYSMSTYDYAAGHIPRYCCPKPDQFWYLFTLITTAIKRANKLKIGKNRSRICWLVDVPGSTKVFRGTLPEKI